MVWRTLASEAATQEHHSTRRGMKKTEETQKGHDNVTGIVHRGFV